MADKQDTLSTRLKEARRKKRYSQADLANIIETSALQVGRYERGAQPTAALLSKLANALDVTIDYLVDGKDYPNRFQGSNDIEFIRRFERISKLPARQQEVLFEVMEAFLEQNFLREGLSHAKHRSNSI